MDVEIVNVIIESVLNVLSTTAGLDAKLDAPYMKAANSRGRGMSGTLTITGELEMAVALRFSDACILDVCSRMFGEPITELDQDVQDAVGEIVNMICGQATNTLAQKGLGMETRPGSVFGVDETDPGAAEEGIVFPFASEAGEFLFEVRGVAS